MAGRAGTGVGRSAHFAGAMAESHCDGFKPSVDFKLYLRFKFQKRMQSKSLKIRLFVAVYPRSFDTHTFERLDLEIRKLIKNLNDTYDFFTHQ